MPVANRAHPSADVRPTRTASRCGLLAILALVALALGTPAGLGQEVEFSPLQTLPEGCVIACDQQGHRIIALDPDRDWADPESVLWQWQAAMAPDLAEQQRNWFRNPTDAKPLPGGRQMLVTASGGAVAVLALDDPQPVFLAYGDHNPHSSELLPDGRIAAASSTPNLLLVFDPRPGVEWPERGWRKEFEDAHGLAWDAGRRLLWAIGYNELAAFRYHAGADPFKGGLDGGDGQAMLERVDTHELPAPGGHDLCFDATGRRLLLTTNTTVEVFDPATRQFAPFAPRHEIRAVKSISERRPGGPWLLMAATERWWSDTGIVLTLADDPAGEGQGEPAGAAIATGPDRVNAANWLRPDARFYKLRWWLPPPEPVTQP